MSPNAAQCIEFKRDESDSFIIDLKILNTSHAQGELVEKNDILPLLPAGSHWVRAEGWRSFFGTPFSFKGRLWLAIGMQGVRKHPTRGAYPIAKIYLFDFNSFHSEKMTQLASILSAGCSERGRSAPTYGIIASDAERPEEHISTECWILNKASASYRQGERLLFKTLLLSEDDLPPMKGPIDRIKSVFDHRDSLLNYEQILFGTVQKIRDHFSAQARLRLMAYARVGFDNP